MAGMNTHEKWKGFMKPLPEKTRMNKTEAAWAEHLESMRIMGQIKAWQFEEHKIRLANNTWYTPDFFVVYPGHFEIHEVKGFWRDDARVKIKIFSEQYWWIKVFSVTKKAKKYGGGWEFETFA